MFIIMTECAYTRHGLSYIGRRLSAYRNSYGRNIILFDSRTISLADYMEIRHAADWLLIFYAGINQINAGHAKNINNMQLINVQADIDVIIHRCARALDDFNNGAELHWLVKTPGHVQRRRKKHRMLQLLSQGYTIRMASEMMGVNHKTLYCWAGEFIKELDLRNLTQLRYLSVTLGAEKIATSLFK